MFVSVGLWTISETYRCLCNMHEVACISWSLSNLAFIHTFSVLQDLYSEVKELIPQYQVCLQFEALVLVILFISIHCFLLLSFQLETWLQERVKKLKKDHGNVELGKITVDMVTISFSIDRELQVTSSINCCPPFLSISYSFLEVFFLTI